MTILRRFNNTTCKNCQYKTLCLPKGLTEQEQDSLTKLITKIIVLEKGEHIYRQNEKNQGIYSVLTGFCKDYHLDKDGNECIDTFYFPGDLMGLESLSRDHYLLSGAALEHTKLCIIPTEPLLNLMQSSINLLKRFIDIMSYKMQNDKFVSLTTNAKRRIADFLLNVFNRLAERNMAVEGMQLPMTQIDISNLLGMSYETVSRILHQFQQQNIIKIADKKISILNINALINISSQREIVTQS